MFVKQVNYDVERFLPRFDEGLKENQVEQRKTQGLTNKKKVRFGKACLKILKENFLTWLNLLFLISISLWIPAILISGYPFYYLIILASVLFLNIFLGLVHDFRVKLMVKNISKNEKTHVIRDGKEYEVDFSNIVLDDVVSLKTGDVIPSDSVILTGTVTLNESYLSGKSALKNKNPGDFIYTGTVIEEGTCFARVDRVNEDNVASYIDNIEEVKQEKTPLQKSLNKTYLSILIISIFLVLISIILSVVEGNSDIGATLIPLVNQLSVIIPLGLSLLINVILLFNSSRLQKRDVLVSNLTSLEAFARSDVVIFDKTGTLTDGKLLVHNIVSIQKPIGDSLGINEISDIIYNILSWTNNQDELSKACLNYLKPSIKNDVLKILPYNDDNKYSGISFASGMTYILGSIESLNIENKADVLDLAKNYKEKGFRILLLGKSNKMIKSESFYEMIKPVGFVVFKDNVKEDALSTIKFLEDNNVEIKVVSGDNPVSASESASQVGIKGAEKYISLEGVRLEQIPELVKEYVVFGNADADQKLVIVKALKQDKKSVTMVGDGYNDVNALKLANCSVSLANAAQEAKNCADIVLLDNSFNALKEIYNRGKKTTNALSKLSMLYLTKSLFGAVIAVLFVLLGAATNNQFTYPFTFENFFIYEIFTVILTFILVYFDNNDKDIRRNYSHELHKGVVFSSIALLIGAVVPFVFYALQINNVVFTGVGTYGISTEEPLLVKGGFAAVSILSVTVLSIFGIIYSFRPLNKYMRLVIVFISVLITSLVTLSVMTKIIIFGIDFDTITISNIVVAIAISLITGMVFLTIQSVIKALKGK